MLTEELLHEKIIISINEFDSQEALTIPNTMHLCSSEQRLQNIPLALITTKRFLRKRDESTVHLYLSYADQQSSLHYHS